MHACLDTAATWGMWLPPRLPFSTLRRLIPPLSLPDISSLSLKLASVSGGLVTLLAGVDRRLWEAAWLQLGPPCVRLAAAVPTAAVEAALARLPWVKDSARRGGGLGCLGWEVGLVKEEKSLLRPDKSDRSRSSNLIGWRLAAASPGCIALLDLALWLTGLGHCCMSGGIWWNGRPLIGWWRFVKPAKLICCGW